MLATRLNRSRRWGVLLVAAALGAGCAGEPEVAADLVLRGGKVVTVDEQIPDGEAIAVRGDTILAVGSNAEVNASAGPDHLLWHR